MSRTFWSDLRTLAECNGMLERFSDGVSINYGVNTRFDRLP